MKANSVRSLKPMNPRSLDVKYTGLEPEWIQQPLPESRASAMMRAFGWYNYHYGKKEVKTIVLDWLQRHDRTATVRAFARVPENSLPSQLGWICRMNLRGLVLTEQEQHYVDTTIDDHVKASAAVRQLDVVAEPTAPRVTIQDRLRDKAYEIAGELEGLYDDVIQSGARATADHKPMAVLRGMNISPQMIAIVTEHWQQRLAQLESVQEGRDAGLAEGYSNFGRTDIKNLIKFCQQVLADCASYVQIKKTERSPRKKKPVSPERLTQRFRYLREFDELKLKSEPVTKLVGASEAWLYDVKKRKLIYVVADSHIGTMTVKSTGLVGFDATKSVQKTLRKPVEQIPALMSGGAPAARKFFRDIRSTETRFNGRGNDNLILLRIR